MQEHAVTIHTVITVLNKLVEKGLLRRAKRDDLLHYEATLGEEEFRAQASRQVVEEILSFGPDSVTASFVDVLAERDPAQLAELARLIEQRMKERNEAEIQADDRAAREQPLALASAILALASWRTPGGAWGEGVGFAQRTDLLDRRIRRLAGEEPPPVSRLTRGSVVGAMLALAFVGASGAIMSHPLPVDHLAHPSNHCGHPGESPFGHLFCRWDARHEAGRLCPHAPVA